MSLRFRRSMKLLPGVRLNFSKETVGLSFGVPGARYTMNSQWRALQPDLKCDTREI